MTINWYVGTDWTVLPAGGNSLRQVFVRLEDCQVVEAELAALRETHRKNAQACMTGHERIAALETALTLLTNGFKYSTEVVTIARDALEAK
jgi:hypothetical protein